MVNNLIRGHNVCSNAGTQGPVGGTRPSGCFQYPWTSSQLQSSIHPWTSSQLLFSIHPWTSSQCELNTPVGLRPSCELNTPVGLRPSCDLNTPFGLRPSCQLNTPVSVRLSYELNTPVGLRPSCANLQYTPLPFPYLFPIESHRFKKKVLLRIIDFHHTHTTHNHTRTHTHTHNHTRTRTGKSVASEKDSMCSSFLGGSVAPPFIDLQHHRFCIA